MLICCQTELTDSPKELRISHSCSLCSSPPEGGRASVSTTAVMGNGDISLDGWRNLLFSSES